MNGDPARDRGLRPRSEVAACEAFAQQLAAVRIDLCVVSEFLRAQQDGRSGARGTASGAQPVPRVVDPDLNDIRVGELEGRTLDDYREWKHGRDRDDPFPGGESLNDAARRYADATSGCSRGRRTSLLVVCHEIPVRYVVNAAAGSAELDPPLHDIPNATPYLFDPDGLRRAVDRIRELAGNA